MRAKRVTKQDYRRWATKNSVQDRRDRVAYFRAEYRLDNRSGPTVWDRIRQSKVTREDLFWGE